MLTQQYNQVYEVAGFVVAQDMLKMCEDDMESRDDYAWGFGQKPNNPSNIISFIYYNKKE